VTGPVVNLHVIPVGGAVRLHMPGYLQPPADVTSITIARAVSGGTFTTFYSGPPVENYIDCGDSTPLPLSSAMSYLWQVTDVTGTTQVGPAVPASSVISTPDALTQLLIRLLQGGINNLTLPLGFILPQITIKFPQNGLQALPFIVVNLDLIQQTEVQIGEDVVNPNPGQDWTLWVNAKRVWRVSVLSADAEERDFYRDSLLMLFRVLKATVFTPIGYNVSHSFQANSYTDVNEWEGKTPGFYGADLMMELNGIFNTAVLTNFGIIQEFAVTATVGPFDGTETVDQDILVPPTETAPPSA
jgi:hypothetical protein